MSQRNPLIDFVQALKQHEIYLHINMSRNLCHKKHGISFIDTTLDHKVIKMTSELGVSYLKRRFKS